MTHRKLDLEDARSLLLEVVREKGQDYVLSNVCYYFEPDTKEPVCIVGQVLAKAGWTADEVMDVEYAVYAEGREEAEATYIITREQWADTYSSNTVSLRGIPAERLKMTEEAKVYLREAQSAQDRGKSWGEALSVAEGEIFR